MNPDEFRLKELTELILFYEKYEKEHGTKVPHLLGLLREREALLKKIIGDDL